MDRARIITNELRIFKETPVVVSMADPMEKTWGYHRIPTVSRMPDGGILLTYVNNLDSNLCYGHAGPSFMSYDEGRSWQIVDLDEKGLAISDSPVTKVYEGEYICVPMPVGITSKELPEEFIRNPAGKIHIYRWLYQYRLEDAPKNIQDYFRYIRCIRWKPDREEWIEEKIDWDIQRSILKVEGEDYTGMSGQIVHTSFENPPVRYNGEIIQADYKNTRMREDGSIPKNTVCCMVSKDNGHSFKFRSFIAAYDEGQDDLQPNESDLVETLDGRLLCVSRNYTHKMPMLLFYSDDAGYTWSQPSMLFDKGAFPQTLLLKNGILVLSYGRPGDYISFSPDGSGITWTEPVTLVKSDEIDCGYSRLLELSENTFLAAYTDFDHLDARGRKRKAIITQRITVER